MRAIRILIASLAVALAVAACGTLPPPETVIQATTEQMTSPSSKAVSVAAAQSSRATAMTTTTSSCQAGVPNRIVWPDMGIDATFEQTSLDSLGRVAPPQDKTKMGWYRGLSKPGQRDGSVVILGHTWPDNTAVFKEGFDTTLRLGSEFTLHTDTGGACRYRVSLKLTGLNKLTDAYPQAVAKYNLYATAGPERVVGTTCTGRFDNSARSHVANSVFAADLIN